MTISTSRSEPYLKGNCWVNGYGQNFGRNWTDADIDHICAHCEQPVALVAPEDLSFYAGIELDRPTYLHVYLNRTYEPYRCCRALTVEPVRKLEVER